MAQAEGRAQAVMKSSAGAVVSPPWLPRHAGQPQHLPADAEGVTRATATTSAAALAGRS